MVFFEQTATRRGYAFADSSTTTTSLIVDLSNLLPLTSDPLTAGVWSVSVDSCYNCGCSVWKGKSNSLTFTAESFIPTPTPTYTPTPTPTSTPTPAPTPAIDYLNLSKADLLSHLQNRDVARDWWSLNYVYRRSLAVRIYRDYILPLFPIHYIYIFAPPMTISPPNWDPYLYNPGAPSTAGGGQKGLGMEETTSVIYAILGDRNIAPDNVWYYSGDWTTSVDTWHPLKPDYSFGLPVNGALCYEWLAAIRVGQAASSAYDWVFFQTQDVDITPGSSYMMPVGDQVGVYNVTGIGTGAWVSRRAVIEYGDRIASWIAGS
jgi:hypothetical protein